MTSFQRASIEDFALANAAYIGASVTFHTVDGNGDATSTLATLYQEITGSDTHSNPQTLDSEGKFSAPVYVDEPVIAAITPKNVANSHSTGVIHADLASDAATAAQASADQAAGFAAIVQDLFSKVKSAVASLQGITAFGLSLIQSASDAAARTVLGLGTAAVKNTGTSGDAVPLLNATMNMGDNTLQRPKILDYGETVNAIGSIGGGTQDIDLEGGNVVTATVDTSTTTFTFSNPPASGTAGSFTLILTNGGSQTVNWPASVDWPSGSAPTLTSSGVDILVFATVDGGTTWYGALSGADYS